MSPSSAKRVVLELFVLVSMALVCAIGTRIAAANVLAARTTSLRSAASVRAPRVACDPPVAQAQAAMTVGPVSHPILRAPTRARQVQRNRSASRTARVRNDDRWVELRPRLYERADGTLLVDLRNVSNLLEFAAGMRVRAASDGGFEVLSLDAQGYLAAAGVRAGDRLVAINGRSTRTLDELLLAYALVRFDSTISLQFARAQGHFVIHAEVLRGPHTIPP